MPEPKVSVIVPNYNHVDHLRQRIDTVLNQTYGNFEVIILDDFSTDGSREIINEYKTHPRVSQIHINSSNTGSPFKQWKKGIDMAAGEWIWIAESDDYADSTFLEKLVAAAKSYPSAGLIYCDSKIVSSTGISDESFGTLKNKRFHTNRWSKSHFNKGLDEIDDYLLPAGTINNTSAVLFNSKILKQADPFDTSFRYIGDKYTFIKVLALSDIAYVAEGLNYYRDPFNTKHADKHVHYFFEQFVVYDWAFRNIPMRDHLKFFNGFYSNTRNSLVKGWNGTKLSLYKKMFALNPSLFLKSIIRNLWMTIKRA